MDNWLYDRYIKNFSVNLLDCTLLGRGHNGVVYMLPEGKVIKICFSEKRCQKEYAILDRIGGNRFFPKVYGMSGNYMIRDYVEGRTLKDYIKKKGMNRELALKVIELLEEFARLGFKKQDIRCKDVMIDSNGKLMIIDPKNFFTRERDFPRHLSKGLYKLGELDFFMSVVQEERPELYKQWHHKVKQYIRKIHKQRL